MKKGDVYFSKVLDIGDLRLDEVFFEFEYIPVLFSCVDKQGNYFLCLCSEIRGSQQWIITPISIKLLIEMLKDNVSIYEAFEKSDGVKIYAIYSVDGEMKYQGTKFEEINKYLLPQQNEFLEDEESFIEYIQ